MSNEFIFSPFFLGKKKQLSLSAFFENIIQYELSNEKLILGGFKVCCLERQRRILYVSVALAVRNVHRIENGASRGKQPCHTPTSLADKYYTRDKLLLICSQPPKM